MLCQTIIYTNFKRKWNIHSKIAIQLWKRWDQHTWKKCSLSLQLTNSNQALFSHTTITKYSSRSKSLISLLNQVINPESSSDITWSQHLAQWIIPSWISPEVFSSLIQQTHTLSALVPHFCHSLRSPLLVPPHL